MKERAFVQPQKIARTINTSGHAGLLQGKCACGETAGPNGECENCRKKRLQKRSAIADSTSAFEREADRAADFVTSGKSAPALSSLTGASDIPVPPIVHEVVQGGGQPMDAATRQTMSHRFGHDFGRVRVHNDTRAQESARAVNAHAYTAGSHLVFDAGRYAPATREGQSLLAHELAHVVQQRGANASPIMRQTPAQSAPKPGARQFVYDRSNFTERFDGEVDAANHRVTLVMGLDFQDYGREEGKEGRIAKFRTKAKSLIEQTWSYVYALQSVCHGGADKFEARVRVETDAAKPHQTVRVWENLGERSKSTDWQQGDLTATERTTGVLIDPKKPPSKENVRTATFHQVPAAHEFGHLMGVDHIVCSGHEDRCYGITAEQKMDIMGYGSVISQRDYAPFVRIMERYGRDHLPKECNSWKLVSPG